MGNFVRGGQLAIHTLRMNLQVWKVLIRCSLAIMVAGVFFAYYKDMTPIDWRNVPGYIKREVAFNDDVQIEYYTKSGYKFSQTKAIAKQNPIFRELGRKFEQIFYKGLISGGVVSLMLIAGTFLYFWRSGKKHRGSKEIRGVFLNSFKKVRREVTKHNSHFKYKPIEIVGMPYPITGSPNSFTAGEQSHTMIVGSTGSGKTAIIKELIYQISQRGDKTIIVDVKGDYIRDCYKEDTGMILNPLDVRGRNWSIFNETDALKGFATISKSLIPIDSKDPTWTEAARVVFTEMANSYSKSNISLAELVDKILKTSLDGLGKILKKTYAEKIINIGIEKASLSVLMVLSSYLRPLKLYSRSENCFSITDWVKEKGSKHCFLFISSISAAKRDLNPLISAQIDIAINGIKSISEESNIPKIWFILDEVGYFDNPIPSLVDGLTTARSYGGCFVLGIQDITALSKIYGREGAETITNNCRTKVFMNVEGAETARWCSENIGKGEIEEWDEGISYGSHEMRDGVTVNKSKKIKPAVIPAELSLFKTGRGVIKLSGFNPAKFRTQYELYGKLAEPYVKNEKLYKTLQKEREEQNRYREKIEEKLEEDVVELVKEGKTGEESNKKGSFSFYKTELDAM